MSSLKALPSSRLSTSQLKNVAIQTMKLTESLLESDDFIQDQHTAMNASIVDMDQIHAYSQVNSKTKDLAQANVVLDDCLTGTRDYLKGAIALRRFDCIKADAAENILHHMESYGRGLIYGGYNEQADLVPAFIKSVKELYAEDLETAVAAHLIEGTKMAIESVIKMYGEKLESQEKPDTTMGKIKKELRYRIDGLLSNLDRRITDKKEGYVTLQEPINELITEVMTQVRAQQTRKENSEAEEQHINETVEPDTNEEETEN